MCRLALVSPMAIHKQGFHPTAILGAFGASIGISKILKNSVSQTTSSLGIVGSMASGIIEYLAEGTWTKRLHPGWAGASGWKSAHLGKNNFKGPRTVLDGKNGIFNSFADSKIIPDFKKLTDDLGSFWHTNNLAIKPFACGTMTQPFIDCAIKAREKINDLNEIKSIICKVGEGTVHRLWEPLSEKRNPTTPYSAKFSVPFCIAVGLYFGKAGLLEFTEEQIKNREILNICSKISYEIDPQNEYPKNYSGEINIILKNSQVIQETQPGLRGGKLFPLDEKEVEEKFFNNLKFGNLSSREVENVKKFFATFFTDPDFSLLH
jgi:2-methylcitrate dehydratase PrpD